MSKKKTVFLPKIGDRMKLTHKEQMILGIMAVIIIMSLVISWGVTPRNNKVINDLTEYSDTTKQDERGAK